MPAHNSPRMPRLPQSSLTLPWKPSQASQGNIRRIFPLGAPGTGLGVAVPGRRPEAAGWCRRPEGHRTKSALHGPPLTQGHTFRADHKSWMAVTGTLWGSDNPVSAEGSSINYPTGRWSPRLPGRTVAFQCPRQPPGRASEVTGDRGFRQQILVFLRVSEIPRLKVSLSHGSQEAWGTG